MDTGKKAKLEIQTNLLHYRAPQHYVFTDKILMHQKIKYNTLTKAKQFYMPTLNEHSHLDTHASHREPGCNVGTKPHLPFVGTYSCQPTHISASSPSTPQGYRCLQLQRAYRNTALPINRKSRNQLPNLKYTKDSRTVSNLKIPRQLLPLILMGSP